MVNSSVSYMVNSIVSYMVNSIVSYMVNFIVNSADATAVGFCSLQQPGVKESSTLQSL